jgi:NAD(P)-dependent dehydrogenase (short-subunit alcohol dehydrogenase family)
MTANGLAGRSAVVTGGGSGIGRATALTLARLGARVVVADVDGPAGEGTVDLITAAGGAAAFIRTDVSHSGDVQRMVSCAVERYGRLDIAVNNAGIDGPHRPLADVSEQEWDATIAVDLKGVWLCLKHEILAMLHGGGGGGGGGAIVNTSSAAGLTGVSGAAAYCAAKHGVLGLTRTAALDYARSGIRINAVCPGLVQTPLVSHVLGNAVDDVVQARIPMGRIGRADEIAAAIAWLASDDAAFVTGTALTIDGGGLAGT